MLTPGGPVSPGGLIPAADRKRPGDRIVFPQRKPQRSREDHLQPSTLDGGKKQRQGQSLSCDAGGPGAPTKTRPQSIEIAFLQLATCLSYTWRRSLKPVVFLTSCEMASVVFCMCAANP